MTPIPPDVAALIGATGHSIQASAEGAWLWGGGELRVLPSWLVFVSGSQGREKTARAATLNALARLAAEDDKREKAAHEEAKRLRRPDYKASALRDAETAAKRAADVRALAAQVAAMWPEVGT